MACRKSGHDFGDRYLWRLHRHLMPHTRIALRTGLPYMTAAVKEIS